MAIVARFCFDVPFGKKVELMRLMKKFEPMQIEMGFPKPLVLIGSIGAPESRIEINHTFPSLTALEGVWAKLNDPRMGELQQEMAPFVVPGSHRWEVYRVQEG
jgi:hypothetical protein